MKDHLDTLIVWGLYAVGACAVLCACVLLLPFYMLSVWTDDFKELERLAVRVVYRFRKKVYTLPERVQFWWRTRHDP